MTRHKTITFIVALALIGSTAGLLASMRSRQKLGAPGVKTSALPESQCLHVDLPERVLDYESVEVPQEQIVLDILPRDTSFGQRRYTAADTFQMNANVVLMGTDRTSIHKPQFCLGGTGWIIDDNLTTETTVHVERPYPYDLPVMKLIANKMLTLNGAQVPARGIYVYWFVAKDEYTAKHWQRMYWMARDLFRTGVLQRWAYVSYFAICPPGQEDAAWERMKKLIAASVPEFQLTPQPLTQAAFSAQ
jgi:hypothetical protein